MKRRLLSLFLVLLMIAAIPMSVFAATPRAIAVNPRLSFEGTTAKCGLTVMVNTMSDKVSAVIMLWDGNKCIKAWTKSSNGTLVFSDTATVTIGKEYRLTADVTINGVTEPRFTITRTCK